MPESNQIADILTAQTTLPKTTNNLKPFYLETSPSSSLVSADKLNPTTTTNQTNICLYQGDSLKILAQFPAN